VLLSSSTPLYLLLLFLSTKARAPAHPHTFPTRRSSDLPTRSALATSACCRSSTPSASAPTPSSRTCSAWPGANAPMPTTSTWPQDRKSTRLNSSHVKSSYAVFCLKKKNQRGNHLESKTF